MTTLAADCGARASGEGGTGAGLGEAGVAAPTPYVEALQRAGALEAILMPVAIDDADAAPCSSGSTGSC